MKKLPQITLIFWIMKIAATTLGETGGDLLAQTLNVGYAVSSIILIGLFLISLITQLRADKFHPALYWTVILSTSTAGTTMSDFMDRSAGLGYAKGSMVLISLLAVTFVVWKLSGHSFDVQNVSTFRGEILYWTAILISNTLGTAFGDFLADDSGLGFGGTAMLIAGLILATVLAMKFTPISNTLLFWAAFVLTRPLGASVGDFFSKPTAKGGLGYGTIGASSILAGTLLTLIIYTYWQQRPAMADGQLAHGIVAAPDGGAVMTMAETMSTCPTCAAPDRIEPRRHSRVEPRGALVVTGVTALVVLAVVIPVAVYTHSQAAKTDTVLAAVRTVQVDSAARAAADKTAADKAAAHDKLIAEAAAAKAIADRAATDKAATDQAAAAKAAADKAAAQKSAARDKLIAEAAAAKAIAGKAASDASANGSGASASEQIPCQKMYVQRVPYVAVMDAWTAVGSPPGWDADHDSWPCEKAYGEMK